MLEVASNRISNQKNYTYTLTGSHLCPHTLTYFSSLKAYTGKLCFFCDNNFKFIEQNMSEEGFYFKCLNVKIPHHFFTFAMVNVSKQMGLCSKEKKYYNLVTAAVRIYWLLPW